LAWAKRLEAEGRFGAIERLILEIGFGEYLAQVKFGLPMSQLEILRPADLGLEVGLLADDTIDALIAGNSPAARARLAELVSTDGAARFGDCGLDETLSLVRASFRRFAEDRIIPYAHDWHLNDQLIPIDVIDAMSGLGVFGLTIPENLGGHGLGKVAMCVVSEELSRAYIGVGSLGTRAEIAAELIMTGGTDAQKERWLPKIAAGAVLPTAVFTEPDTGSDLASFENPRGS